MVRTSIGDGFGILFFHHVHSRKEFAMTRRGRGEGSPLSPTLFSGEKKKGATRSLNQVDNKKVCLEDDHGSTNAIIEAVDTPSQGVISQVARTSAKKSRLGSVRHDSCGSCRLATDGRGNQPAGDQRSEDAQH